MSTIFTVIANNVENHIQQTSRQADTCDRVVGNIRGGMNPLQGGGWDGNGARAFFQEVLTKTIPLLMELIAAILGWGGNIGKGLNIMKGADKAVSGIVGQVSGIFEKIF